LKHTLFFAGNKKKIKWVIKTGKSVVVQEREQAEIYLDKVTDEQSKYIALHVGIFWGIGKFIIKKEDLVEVMIDSRLMLEHLSKNQENYDFFIEKRIYYINQLIEQRMLNLQYYKIKSNENLAHLIIDRDD